MIRGDHQARDRRPPHEQPLAPPSGPAAQGDGKVGPRKGEAGRPVLWHCPPPAALAPVGGALGALAMSTAPAPSAPSAQPLVGVIMGSRSDLAVMGAARAILVELGVPFETRVVSAHRTPEWMLDYARTAEGRGLEVIIAAAGGAAHLPGMVAACTLLPVLGVPIPATALLGVDALLSIVQMPKGVPVATLAVGEPGAVNAALLAAQILAAGRPWLRERLRARREAQRQQVLAEVIE